MIHYILDACALVNLHCGWGDLRELRSFGATWSIGAVALKEAMFAREFNSAGDRCKVTLDPEAIVNDSGLQVLSLDASDEHASFLEFAMELDDGEAEAMALALHRGRVLATDDRPAVRIASSLSSVQTMETPEILIEWIQANPDEKHRLPRIIHRISELGSFHLRKNSPHYQWWHSHLSNWTG